MGMTEELKPCPLCGTKVDGHVCGGEDRFGCGEWEYEIECECGLLFTRGPHDTPEETETEAIKAWNRRV